MRKYKRNLTLLEIMIVIVLIGLIGSVIGFNMKGSLDEGRAFKSRQAQEQIRDILTLEIARGTSVDRVVERAIQVLDNSGLIKGKAENFVKDGWGKPFEIKAGPKDTIVVESATLKAYEKKKRDKLGKTEVDEENNEG